MERYFLVMAEVFGRAYKTIMSGASTTTIMIAAWRIVSIIKPKKTEISAVAINITTGNINAGPDTRTAPVPTTPAALITMLAIAEIVAEAMVDASAFILPAATDLMSTPIPLPAI